MSKTGFRADRRSNVVAWAVACLAVAGCGGGDAAPLCPALQGLVETLPPLECAPAETTPCTPSGAAVVLPAAGSPLDAGFIGGRLALLALGVTLQHALVSPAGTVAVQDLPARHTVGSAWTGSEFMVLDRAVDGGAADRLLRIGGASCGASSVDLSLDAMFAEVFGWTGTELVVVDWFLEWDYPTVWLLNPDGGSRSFVPAGMYGARLGVAVGHDRVALAYRDNVGSYPPLVGVGVFDFAGSALAPVAALDRAGLGWNGSRLATGPNGFVLAYVDGLAPADPTTTADYLVDLWLQFLSDVGQPLGERVLVTRMQVGRGQVENGVFFFGVAGDPGDALVSWSDLTGLQARTIAPDGRMSDVVLLSRDAWGDPLLRRDGSSLAVISIGGTYPATHVVAFLGCCR